MILFYVGMGGFLGAILRFLISGWVQKISSSTFPVGTLSVNILGSFFIGFLVVMFENFISPHWKAFLVTGLLGALTTFSTFSYETVILLQEGLFLKAGLNVVLNVFFCFTATILGIALFHALFRL